LQHQKQTIYLVFAKRKLNLAFLKRGFRLENQPKGLIQRMAADGVGG
jgi:hypothetical protein